VNGIRLRCARRCKGCDQRLSTTHLVVNLNLAAVETVVGLISGSKALAVLAIFSLRGCILAGIVAASTAGARRPNATGRASARGKVEFLVAAGMSMSSLVGVAALCYALLHTLLQHPLQPPSWAAAWVALGSAAVCWVMANHAECAGQRVGNRALEAHASQSRGHAYVALAVVVAVVMTRYGFAALDSITAVALAVGAIWRSWRILRKSIAGLMDASVGGKTHDAMQAALARIDGLPGRASVSGLRVGRDISARVTLQVPDGTRMCDVGRARKRIESSLRRMVPDVREVLVGFCPAGEEPAAVPTTRRDTSTERKAIERARGGAGL